MKTAFLFPGQASQKVGMGLDLYNETKIGKKHFDSANEIMGLDLSNIIFKGPEEKLKQTQFTQPAIYIVSVILGKLLIENGVNPIAAAGHSLGEYSALTLAGAFSFESGLELVKLRAESMQRAGENMNGTMAAIIGMDGEQIKEVCDNCKDVGIVVPANYNAPGQIVISGEVNAVKAAMVKATEAGARKVIELNVSGAFHSPLMASAREALAEKLNSTEIADTDFPIYTNVSATPVSKADDIRTALNQQLESPVLWQDTIINMEKDGIENYVEVGPGRVLQGLNRRINRRLKILGVETLNDVYSRHYV